jgi:predicted flap endonuclease-1-like 5' DNA nuclease
VILTLISIGLLLLGLWLYFNYFSDNSSAFSAKLADFCSFSWVPKVFTQPHFLSSELAASTDSQVRQATSKKHSSSANLVDGTHSKNNRDDSITSKVSESAADDKKSPSIDIENSGDSTHSTHTLSASNNAAPHRSNNDKTAQRGNRSSTGNEAEPLKHKTIDSQAESSTHESADSKAESSTHESAGSKAIPSEHKFADRQAKTSMHESTNTQAKPFMHESAGRDKYVEQIRPLESQQNELSLHTKNSTTSTAQNIPKHKKASELHTSTTKKSPLFKAPTEKDDLKKIKGIGPVMEETLNELGVTSFKQLGLFNEDDIQRVSDALEVFPGRIERDEWVKQAKEQYEKKYNLIMN